MDEWISFRGVRSDSLTNVRVSRMPVRKRAGMRFTQYQVKGRDGALHVNEGYGTFEMECGLLVRKGSAGDMDAVNQWATGTGKLITSDRSDRALIATVQKEVLWERYRVGSEYNDFATITFTCQPFLREAVDSVIELTQSELIVNPGSVDAYPTIYVYGDGDCAFEVNGTDVALQGVDDEGYVVLDCANGYVYTNAEEEAAMIGEFPILKVGNNTVNLGENITKLQIVPHWGWI